MNKEGTVAFILRSWGATMTWVIERGHALNVVSSFAEMGVFPIKTVPELWGQGGQGPGGLGVPGGDCVAALGKVDIIINH